MISDDEGEDSEENMEIVAAGKVQSSIHQNAAQEEFESLDLGGDMSAPIISPEGWIICGDHVNYNSTRRGFGRASICITVCCNR